MNKKASIILLFAAILLLAVGANFADCETFEKFNYHPSWRKSCWKQSPCGISRIVSGGGGGTCQFAMVWNPSEKRLQMQSNLARRIGFAASHPEFLKLLRQQASEGDPEAQRTLGDLLSGELGSEAKDTAEAAKWYRKSAEQGDPLGQRKLGWAYSTGAGVEKDLTEAAKWILKAAESGDRVAQSQMREIYGDGLGVKKDILESYYWDEVVVTRSDSTEHAIPPAGVNEDKKAKVRSRARELNNLLREKERNGSIASE